MFGPPADWHYDPPQPDSIVIPTDTIPTDTIPTDTIVPVDTCEWEVINDPAFVTGYQQVPEQIFTDVDLFVGPYQVVIPMGTDMAPILDSLLKLYRPEYTYQVWTKDDDWKTIVFIAKGTNDQNKFHGKVYMHWNGLQSGGGFGVIKQGFVFFGALTFEETMQVVYDLKSVQYVNARFTNWTYDQYLKYGFAILECKDGGNIADFKGLPFTMPDTLKNAYYAHHWNQFLQ
jgi:hypothetical protein